MVYDKAKMNEIKLEQKNPVRIRLPKRKKVILAVLIVLTLLIIAGFSYLLLSGQTEKSSGVCSEKTLQESARLLNENKSNELIGTVQYIERLDGYQTDPNCLYITTSYYIGVTDAEKARKNYDELNKVYKQDQGYNPVFGEAAQSPEQLLVQVVFIEEQSKKPSRASIYEQQQREP